MVAPIAGMHCRWRSWVLDATTSDASLRASAETREDALNRRAHRWRRRWQTVTARAPGGIIHIPQPRFSPGIRHHSLAEPNSLPGPMQQPNSGPRIQQLRRLSARSVCIVAVPIAVTTIKEGVWQSSSVFAH